ncbi:MAG: hypothetical protein IK066_03495 [Kiritimatiellae bacterium]|nr:hypothetical protein [Kiritimatiellia bacterium]
MKLEPEGKKRLESMKKTLAAGLPLAGLLAASAAVGAAAQGCGRCIPGIVVQPAPPEEWRVRGRTVEQPGEKQGEGNFDAGPGKEESLPEEQCGFIHEGAN